jgi:hypothetical protein
MGSIPVLGSLAGDVPTAAPTEDVPAVEGLPVVGDVLGGDAAGLPVFGSLLDSAPAVTDAGQRPVADGESLPLVGSLPVVGSLVGSLPLVDNLPIFQSLPLVGSLVQQ